MADATVRGVVVAGINRLERGLSADVEHVDDGVSELRIHIGLGRRLILVRPQTVGGHDFRFICITVVQDFGVMKHCIDKERFVILGCTERTVINGLRDPAFAADITKVAKGLWT